MSESPTTLTAVIVRTDGTVEKTQMTYDLETMRGIVGGYIEGVFLPDATVYVNEEGHLLGLPPNERILEIVWSYTPYPPYSLRLFGDAIILGKPDSFDYDTDVPNHILKHYELEN